ncbi:MAG: divergent PAP2 family protein [Lachnospirales bacterium]
MDVFNILQNEVLLIAALSWFIAQLIKVIREFIKTKKINKALFTSSGGFPSSHSSAVCALATGIGILDGFQSNTFAIAFILSAVVMYDAAGVRRAAGQQASVLNDMTDFFEKHGFKMDKKLKELLGHSPFEVVSGAVLGVFVAVVGTMFL